MGLAVSHCYTSVILLLLITAAAEVGGSLVRQSGAIESVYGKGQTAVCKKIATGI